MTTITGEVGIGEGRGLLFGHPKGLAVLGATELWDRISFHGMQALLVLYMVGQLFTPGHIEHIAGFATFRAAIEAVTGPLSTQALASQVFGLYVGLVYFTPAVGGAIGDRWLGRKGGVILGAILITAGHFCMAFDESFLIAMALLISGAGFLRGNLAPQVGELYAPEDRRRDVGFQVYYSMVNLGAFIAPVVTGWLAQTWTWHVGFAFAGFGMLVGLVIYVAGQRTIVFHSPYKPETATNAEPLTREERRRVALLIGFVPVSAMFWVAQSQVWNTYNIWVRDHLELAMGGFRVPVPWLQSLDGLAPFICLPPMLMFWRWQAERGREPGSFRKLAIGCFIFAASTLWLSAASWVTDASGRTPFLWAVVFHLASNLGWLYFAPTALAFYSKGAPPRLAATLIGVNVASAFFGSLVSGRIGGFYESLPAAQFWAVHAAIAGLGGVIYLVLGWRFGPIFEPRLRASAQP
jgi:POT family proton-dependent oligopeptide transporter